MLLECIQLLFSNFNSRPTVLTQCIVSPYNYFVYFTNSGNTERNVHATANNVEQ